MEEETPRGVFVGQHRAVKARQAIGAALIYSAYAIALVGLVSWIVTGSEAMAGAMVVGAGMWFVGLLLAGN